MSNPTELNAFSAAPAPALWTAGLSTRAEHLLLPRFRDKDDVRAFIAKHGENWAFRLQGMGPKTKLEIELWLDL